MKDDVVFLFVDGVYESFRLSLGVKEAIFYVPEPFFPTDETSCMQPVYATLIRISEKWHRISMDDLDLTLLTTMRKLYRFEQHDD